MGDPAKVTKVKLTCDTCVGGAPAWRYPLPEGLPLLEVRDPATGAVHAPARSLGAMGLCEECHGILVTRAVPREAVPVHFARRLMNRHPLTRTMTPAHRTRARRALVSFISRVMPWLHPENAVRWVPGADPMDGLQVELPAPGETRPETN